jgi:hypothetical protein
MSMIRMAQQPTAANDFASNDLASNDLASLQVVAHDWIAYRELSLWLFYTPAGAITDLPDRVPAVACISPA